MSVKLKHEHLHLRTIALRDKVIRLARDIETAFGKDDDRTIFARNAYCELQEVANTIVPSSLPKDSKP